MFIYGTFKESSTCSFITNCDVISDIAQGVAADRLQLLSKLNITLKYKYKIDIKSTTKSEQIREAN